MLILYIKIMQNISRKYLFATAAKPAIITLRANERDMRVKVREYTYDESSELQICNAIYTNWLVRHTAQSKVEPSEPPNNTPRRLRRFAVADPHGPCVACELRTGRLPRCSAQEGQQFQEFNVCRQLGLDRTAAVDGRRKQAARPNAVTVAVPPAVRVPRRSSCPVQHGDVHRLHHCSEKP